MELSNSWLRLSLSTKNDIPLLIWDGLQDDFTLQYKASSCLIESLNIGIDAIKPDVSSSPIRMLELRRCLVSLLLNSVISCILSASKKPIQSLHNSGFI
jgi:hypothetical protein